MTELSARERPASVWNAVCWLPELRRRRPGLRATSAAQLKGCAALLWRRGGLEETPCLQLLGKEFDNPRFPIASSPLRSRSLHTAAEVCSSFLTFFALGKF